MEAMESKAFVCMSNDVITANVMVVNEGCLHLALDHDKAWRSHSHTELELVL